MHVAAQRLGVGFRARVVHSVVNSKSTCAYSCVLNVRVRHSTQVSAINSASEPVQASLRNLLMEKGGVEESDLARAEYLFPQLHRLSYERAQEVLSMLLDLGLDGTDITRICLKWPQVFGARPEQVSDVMAFLRQELGLSEPDMRTLLSRFPQVLSYNVKAHLMPQLAYLGSLGVQDIPRLVRERPTVLGEGIEVVIRFLQLCGVQRKQVHLLLRSYPLDYSLQFKGPALQILQSKSKEWKAGGSTDGEGTEGGESEEDGGSRSGGSGSQSKKE